MSAHQYYPTLLHQEAAENIRDFFSHKPITEVVLLVNSCARGTAIPQSDLDMAIIVNPNITENELSNLETEWLEFYASHSIFTQLQSSSKFAGVHLDIIDGKFSPKSFDDSGGPDYFEVEVGNRIAYSKAIWQRTDYFEQLKQKWLPYYDEALAIERLEMVRNACIFDLEHIPFYVERGLFFQAFDRLYKAYMEFLQSVHIAHRVYPLAYNKWIKEQIQLNLGLPDLYTELPKLFEIKQFESKELVEKANTLRCLLDKWAV